MGVFDFVKNAGAKIGIGKSTDEEAAEAKAAEVAKQRAEASAKMAEIRRKAKQKDAAEAAQAKVAAMKEAREKNAARKAIQNAAKERMANYKKSHELEKYVSDMGIDISGVDIRFDDETAYITGEAVDQATRERIILAVGNAQGIARVDEEISVAEADPAEEAHFHTVAPGDTLWAVAEKVYGDGSQYTKIFEENKPMLKDPDLIFPGQVLRCPMD